MNKVYKKILKFVLGSLAGLAVLIVLLAWWLYSGTTTSLKSYIFQSLPLPVAMVNGQWVPMRNFTLRYNVAVRLGGAQTDGLSDEQVKQQAYNQLIIDNEMAQLAYQNNVSVSQKQIDQEYQSRAQNTDLQGYPDFQSLLGSFGLSQTDFEKQIIKPELLTIAMEVWFNSQPSLNQAQYNQANSLLQDIQNGQDMGQLATKFSQDPTGQSVQGDLGMLNATALLPELQDAVEGMAVGEVKIIPSRYGLHIIKLEQKTGDLDHLREIFITTESYSNWFSAQTANYKIKKFLNI